ILDRPLEDFDAIDKDASDDAIAAKAVLALAGQDPGDAQRAVGFAHITADGPLDGKGGIAIFRGRVSSARRQFDERGVRGREVPFAAVPKVGACEYVTCPARERDEIARFVGSV